MRKHLVIYPLMFAVVFLAVVFSYSNLALAEEVDLVYPNDGYIQAVRVDQIGVSESLTVTADNLNKVISYSGETTGRVDFSSLSDSVLKLFVYGQSIVIKGAKGFYLLDAQAKTITAIDTEIINEECYVATDGTYLYVHQYGKVSVYETLDTPVKEYENKVFNSQPIIAVGNKEIFLFESPRGVSKIHSYNTESGEVKTSSFEHIINAVMGDVIFAHNGENILVVDPQSFSTYTTELTAENYAVFGSTVYIPRGADGYDKYAYANGALTYVGNHSYTGDGIDRLKSPAGAVIFDDELVIADTLNNRLLFVGDDVVALEVNAPTALEVGDGRLQVLTGDGVVIIDNRTILTTIKTDIAIVDIAYNNGWYYLAENGVYLFLLGGLHKVFDVNGGKAMVQNGLFYILDSTGVSVISLVSGQYEKSSLLSFDIADYTALDIMVDAVGNVYVLGDDNALHGYAWEDILYSNIDGTSLTSTDILIESSAYDFDAKSMAEMGDKIVVTTKENALVSIDNPLVKECENPSSFDKEVATVSTYVSTDKTYFMANDNDGKTAVKVAKDMVFVCYEFEGKLYTLFGGVWGYVFNADLTPVSTDVAGEYVTKNDIFLYVNPMVDDGNKVSKNTTINVVDNGGGYGDGNWVRVEYGGKMYYTELCNLEKKQSAPSNPSTPSNPQEPEKPVEVKKEYGRAKASRAGELVPLYSDIEGNNVATEVTDGTRLQVVEKIGDYYKVKYNDSELYIRADQFKLDGLTTVQVIAIILSVIVVLTGALIFAITSATKKKEENQ
ncbi:MAG: hypothetical protein J6V37_00475 [Clostridia bacterium]|nr:hypothetical protein [Clostridia bacterium]